MKINLKNKILSSRIFIIIGICLLIFIGFSLGKETYRNYQIQKEIQALEEEITKLKENNEDLMNLIEYFKTESYQEKEARQKLGLQKEGERVVIIYEDNNLSEEIVNELSQSEEIKKERISNLKKWWNFIFVWQDN